MKETSKRIPCITSSRKELKQDAKHRHDKCMTCDAAPEYEVLWVEGMAQAWFCEKHLKEWLKESVARCAKEGFSNKNCELDSIKKLDDKKASIKFGDNKNANILDSFLSQIPMPEVNKEKKRELEEESNAIPKSVGLSDSEELAPVNPSGESLGREITLEEILPYFKSFYIAKPYVRLVGGLVTNGKTKGDIDVYIARKERDKVTEFRISRMLPTEMASRVHFLYPDEAEAAEGVYTSNIGLYDLKLERKEEKKIELMSVEDSVDSVELFKFCKLLKPASGRYKGELYSIESIIELVNEKPEWYESKIAVQIKYDGIHCRADHGKTGRVIIWTEEGNRIDEKLPTIVSELKTICNGHDVVVVGELESWENGKHMARQLTTGIIHSKGIHEKERTLEFNIFDCLYYS